MYTEAFNGNVTHRSAANATHDDCRLSAKFNTAIAIRVVILRYGVQLFFAA